MANPTYIFTEDWFSINIPVWSELLKHHKDRPTQVLEVGSYQGLSAIWLLENILTHPESSITCVDTFEGSEEHNELQTKDMFQLFTYNTQRFGNKVIVQQGRSCDVLRRMPRAPVYDIMYIDGDHHAPAVLEDAILSFPMLKKGGLMIFDDYAWPVDIELDRPKPAIDAFLQIYANHLRVIYRGYQLIIEKLE